MEDLASDRANLRNSPDRRIDFPAWKFTFWDLVFMLSQNTIINKHEVASLGLAAGSHHLISADYNFAWIGNNKCVFVDVHLEFNPLEHSLQTFFALHWVAIAPFFVIKIHKVSNRVKTAAYLERSSRYINQISCFEVLILRFGPQLVSIKLVILIHKVANRKIMNMEGGPRWTQNGTAHEWKSIFHGWWISMRTQASRHIFGESQTSKHRRRDFPKLYLPNLTKLCVGSRRVFGHHVSDAPSMPLLLPLC